MTFREQLDCPLCHRGTVEVLVYGPELPFDTELGKGEMAAIALELFGAQRRSGAGHKENLPDGRPPAPAGYISSPASSGAGFTVTL